MLTINNYFMYLLSFPKWKNVLKKSLERIRSYKDPPFLRPECLIFPEREYFWKHINKPCSFHLCLSTFKKSKSEINTLLKYWQFQNTVKPH